MSNIEGFAEGDDVITPELVQEWLEANRWDKRYIEAEGEQTEERWTCEVNGAKILADMFSQMSQTRVEYQKIECGEWLTDWLIANSPDDLSELAQFLGNLLSAAESVRQNENS